MDSGDLMALDGKINSDDNAAFRQPRLVTMRDVAQADETEVLASQHDLNYVTMDGNIGCMVNGAGLAMAPMDVIKRSEERRVGTESGITCTSRWAPFH